MAALVLAWSIPTTASAQQATAASASSLVFDGVTVVGVESGTLVPEQRVVIAGNRIQAVGNPSAVEMPKKAQVVDARGKYLIPGLWDMHAHVYGSCDQDYAYPLFIANGVTGIRDLNVGSVTEALQLRREVVQGTRVGPRAIVSSPALNVESVERKDCHGRPIQINVGTPEHARHVVDSLKAVGADFLKIYEGPSRDVLFAVAAEARRVGIPFGGHLPMSDGPGNTVITAVEATDSGWRSLEHVRRSAQFCKELGECTALAARFKRNGTWVTPTMTIIAAWDADPRDSTEWPTKPTSDWMIERRQLQLLRQAGVPMLAGTDVTSSENKAYPPGRTLHDELRLLVWAGGLTPLAALQTATLNPAQYLNATDSLGNIAPGKLADLVLLDANPLADITNTTTIRAVVANGHYYDRAALDKLLADAPEGKTKAP